MRLNFIVENPETGKQYKLETEKTKFKCAGCAFDSETLLCLGAGNECSEQDKIWTEILKVEKVD